MCEGPEIFAKIFSDAQQSYLEVIDGNLVFSGVAVCERFDNASVIAFGLQHLCKLLQHSGTMGRNSCVTGHVTKADASKFGEQFLGVRVLCK